MSFWFFNDRGTSDEDKRYKKAKNKIANAKAIIEDIAKDENFKWIIPTESKNIPRGIQFEFDEFINEIMRKANNYAIKEEDKSGYILVIASQNIAQQYRPQ